MEIDAEPKRAAADGGPEIFPCFDCFVEPSRTVSTGDFVNVVVLSTIDEFALENRAAADGGPLSSLLDDSATEASFFKIVEGGGPLATDDAVGRKIVVDVSELLGFSVPIVFSAVVEEANRAAADGGPPSLRFVTGAFDVDGRSHCVFCVVRL